MATPFKLNNGMLLLSTEAPGGVYNSAQLKKIAQLCDGDAAMVKATEDQRLALFVPEAKAKQVVAELKAIGLGIRNYQDGLHQPVNCVGELCPQHQQDAMGAAMDLSLALAPVAKQAFGAALKIGINGCTACCVPTHTLDISVIGDTTGYRVSLGGKNSQIPEMASFMAEHVPAAELPALLTKVVNLYKRLAQPGERLQEVMERCGATEFIIALAPYSQDAAGHDAGDPFGGIAIEPDVGGEDLIIDTMGGETLDDEIAIDAGDSSEMLADDLTLSEESPPEGSLMMEETETMSEAEEELEIAPDEFGSDELATDVILSEDISPEEIPLDELAPEEMGQDELSFDDEPVVEAPVRAADKPKLVVATKVEEPALDDFDLDSIDGEAALEVDGDEADAFEAKLEESIAEEESHPVEADHNEEDRLAALTLVETNTDLPSVEAVHENLGVDDSFENLEIDHDDIVEVDMEPEEIPEATPIMPAPRRTTSSSSALGHSFKGIDVGDGGRITLSFASGATVELDPRTMRSGQARDFMVGGTQIVISQDAAGFTVEVDGVGIFLPVRAA